MSAFAFTIVSLSIAISAQQGSCAKSDSILIIALPQAVDSDLTLSWEREEILPGALAAAEIINNDSSLLPLKLLVADSGPVTRYKQPYSGNVLEVIANLTWHNKSADIIGIAGMLHPDILLALQNFHLPLASLVHFGDFPNIVYMTASASTLADSIIAFVVMMNQSNIGLLTELHHSYSLSVSNELHNKIADSTLTSVSFYIQIGMRYKISSIMDQIATANVRIIVVSVRPSVSKQLLYEAYERHLMWPKYVWVVHSLQLDELLLNISEGIFLFQLVPNERDYGTPINESCWRSCDQKAVASQTYYGNNPNPFAFFLHDAILTLTLAAYNRCAIPVDAICSNSSEIVYIYSIFDGTTISVGIYNGHLHSLTYYNASFPYKVSPFPLVLKEVAGQFQFILLTLPLLCLVTNTVLLILYLCFYNKPSVKSTSVSLSLLIFLGCYLLTLFSMILMIGKYLGISNLVNFCMILVWLSGLGVSIPLILATILVKMLRVYHIFSLRRVMKKSLYTSNCAYFVYTLLILSPNLTILVLWNAIDPDHVQTHYVEDSGFIKVEEMCVNKHTDL